MHSHRGLGPGKLGADLVMNRSLNQGLLVTSVCQAPGRAPGFLTEQENIQGLSLKGYILKGEWIRNSKQDEPKGCGRCKGTKMSQRVSDHGQDGGDPPPKEVASEPPEGVKGASWAETQEQSIPGTRTSRPASTKPRHWQVLSTLKKPARPEAALTGEGSQRAPACRGEGLGCVRVVEQRLGVNFRSMKVTQQLCSQVGHSDTGKPTSRPMWGPGGLCSGDSG